MGLLVIYLLHSRIKGEQNRIFRCFSISTLEFCLEIYLFLGLMQWLQQAVKTSLSICPELRVKKCCSKKLEGMSAAIMPKINIAFPPESGPDKYKNNNNVTFDFFLLFFYLSLFLSRLAVYVFL